MRFSVQCVRVEFRYSQSLLNVCVHDDGKGFQPDELSKAVKPYYHGESVGTEHYGMGLFDFEEAREQSQAAQKEKKTGVA